MAHVAIIGAGLTGISTAYHLEKMGFTDYKLFEKESEPGGLCRTVVQDGFTFDYTGHLLHTGDPYFRSLIETVIGLDELNVIQRRSFIYSEGVYSKYPYQVNLFGLPKQTIIDCISGYVQRPVIDKPQSFRNWVLTTFGEGFGNHFFYPYQEKIFAYDIDKLTASWTNKFVPSTSLEQILHGALEEEKETSIGYNAQFFYPKQGGIFSWVKKLADQICTPIHTDMTVERIDIAKKQIIFENGHIEPYNILINTIPLDTFLCSIKEPANSNLISAVPHLKCNEVINFNLGINRQDLSDKHWIYYPEKQFPFYRIGFPHNFATSMTPPHCSSLYGEFSHIGKSYEWVQDTLAHALKQTKLLFDLAPHEILTEKIIAISHAYVIYDQWHDTQLPTLHEKLHEHNIFSIGRYGAWKYSSMQDAVLDGKTMAEQVIDTYIPTAHYSHTKELHD